RDHSRRAQGARCDTGAALGTGCHLRARSPGARAGAGRLEGRGASFPGVARAGRSHQAPRGAARVAAGGGARVLGKRAAARGIRARHAAVSGPLARCRWAADPHRQHRSRHGAARRLARSRPDPRARGADPAAVSGGPVRGDLGPVTANDTYAGRDVWEAFRRDAYHSPTVVWGRDVNALLAGLARQLPPGDVGAQHAAPLQDALRRISDAVDRSGLRHAELWSYTIENGRLVPSRYGSSSDVQLWSLTDLAVQYLLNLH